MSDSDSKRSVVREHYGKIARNQAAGCGPACGSACCGSPSAINLGDASVALGYGIGEIGNLPEGANLGLGCGNPQAIAALRPGEIVLDLGSGGGIDCFLAAQSVGPNGRVIGVDMTADMLRLARENLAKSSFSNIEFRLGEIENLPIADQIVDVIISNCVVNLSPNKPRVFQEAFRVLKSGGRLAISDMVAGGPLPAALIADLERHSQCISGATPLAELDAMIRDAGFTAVKIEPKQESRAFVKDWAPGTGIEDYIVSATIEAVKP